MNGPRKINLRRKLEPRLSVESSFGFAHGDVALASIEPTLLNTVIDEMGFDISRGELPENAHIHIQEDFVEHNSLRGVDMRVLTRREYRASISRLRMTNATSGDIRISYGHSLLTFALLELGAKLWRGYLSGSDSPIRQTRAFMSWMLIHDDSFVFFVKHQTVGDFLTTCLVSLDNGGAKFIRMSIHNETAESVNKASTVSEFFRVANTLPWGSQL